MTDTRSPTLRRYYESARAESMASSCPGAKPMGKGWCILDNLLEESKLGVAAVRANRCYSRRCLGSAVVAVAYTFFYTGFDMMF